MSLPNSPSSYTTPIHRGKKNAGCVQGSSMVTHRSQLLSRVKMLNDSRCAQLIELQRKFEIVENLLLLHMSKRELNTKLNPIKLNDAIIITPIAQIYKPTGQPDSKKDYKEQCECVKKGHQLCWDDSRHTVSKVGDVFGFWHYKRRVEIHRIESVHHPSERLLSWSENVGQGDRQVLMLSQKICEIPWDTWVSDDMLGGAKRCMGTTAVKKNLNQIMTYINSHINN